MKGYAPQEFSTSWLVDVAQLMINQGQRFLAERYRVIRVSVYDLMTGCQRIFITGAEIETGNIKNLVHPFYL